MHIKKLIRLIFVVLLCPIALVSQTTVVNVGLGQGGGAHIVNGVTTIGSFTDGAMFYANGAILTEIPNVTWDDTNKGLVKSEILDISAGAWLGTPANNATVDTLNGYFPIKDFDTTTAETLIIDFRLPAHFSSIDSVQLEIGTGDTAGDSAQFAVKWLGVAKDELWALNTSTFSSALSGLVDMGTTANQHKQLTISGSFTSLSGSDRMVLKLYRDPSVANDVAADVYLLASVVFGKGLR